MPESRREESLRLAEELLGDFELRRAAPMELARKTSRLARLLDDTDAMAWLRYETAGYPSPLDASASRAARRSNRHADKGDDGQLRWWTAHLAAMEANVEAARAELSGGAGPPSSAQSALIVEREKAQRRGSLMKLMSDNNELIERILASFHEYTAARYQELRFGSAVETAFEVVRLDVDARIADLVPDALPKLTAAFENTTSTNPEDWANAASTCRRLLKAAADALRPPGADVNGRKMDDDHYINRLIDWINTRAESETMAALVSADLEFLGRRLNAALDAGHKGAHAEVSRFDASRYVTGTYLLLGDVLRLQGESPAAGSS